MFATIRNRLSDVRTISSLCEEAERIGRSRGDAMPGSEHFVIASFTLEDGTARRAIESLGASPEAFASAIDVQFAESLRHVGVEAGGEADPTSVGDLPAPKAQRVYRAAPSGQLLVQRITAAGADRKKRTLLAADVLLAVSQEEHSIAARALRVLKISSEELARAARREILAYGQTP